MRLKKLHLHGFKTFAERTEIAFSDGVTAVVGPNGSGKSNIADAILWVLGEQKASAVRGATAKDVIFSGSDKRRPMGMAEVSLTVDNSDGKLPVEFNEVTITRRAYRTGEGEYFINKTPCRLKDIYELFLDTGVGREAYSLVNQSEIDAVLSVNPEDRRGLFEEAAGIRKYRVKKREALRKLETTETNLNRVRDILTEIEGRIEPLKYQAERAQHYTRLRDRLRSIETNLLIVDLRTADAELNAVRRARDAEQIKVEEGADALVEAQTRLGETGEKLEEAELALEERRTALQQAMSAAERAESRRALAEQRARGLQQSIALLTQELDGLAARQTSLEDQAQDLAGTLAETETGEGGLKEDALRHQAHVSALTEQINALTRQGERRRQEAMNLARQHAARQADMARAEARVAEIETGLPAQREESGRLSRVAEERAADVQTAQTALDDARTAAQEAVRLAAEARATFDSHRQMLHQRQNEVNAAHTRTLGVGTRLRTLQDLENAQEGYYAGVKAVTDAARRGKLQGSYTVVADAFIAPEGYETAFETALGGSLQDIITGSEAEAKAAIGFLYDARLGRATFLPLDRMRPMRDSLDLGRAQGLTGFLGAAMELIEYDKRFRPALETLLGRVLICETLDDATRVSHVARGWSRIVTLTGEVVSPSGAMTGGRQQGRNAGQILGRKTEIAGLKRDLADCQKEEAACMSRLEKAEDQREAAEKAVSELQAARSAAELAANDAERRAQFAAAEARRASEARDTTLRRIEAAMTSLAQAREIVAKAAEALASTGEQTADADEAMATETEQIRALTAERETAQGELTAARVTNATQAEKINNLRRSLQAARSEIAMAGQNRERKAHQLAEATAEHAELMANTSDRDSEAVHAAQARDAAVKVLEVCQLERHALAQAVAAATQELRRFEDERAAALDAIHKHELKEARLDMQRTQLSTRLMEEYEIEAADALALEEDPEVTDGSPQEVNRVRRELKAMGDVNTAAIEEYAEVSERFDFLSVQKADLEESRQKLLDAIKDIDESTRGVFMATFNAVGEAFQEIFARLFRGGKTDLVLTNPDDLLETGIDIMVQPPGKKRQNLALLSGGERALTATALLFAFLRVKPSPFVVMDEVDAPLDGANVERFADLLREFGEKSQFIIITHNPTTMEAAPIWYGITMQEPGISRVLSMQVPAGVETTRNGHPNGHKAEITPEPAAA